VTAKRAVFYYESAKRSVLAAEALLKRLETELAELEPFLSNADEIAERFGPMLITAMSIVDFSHRFGQLMEGMPLLSKPVRRKHLQKLMGALTPVQEIRNHLQHLREELAAGADIDYPLMGSITWTKGQQCHAVALLTQGFEVTFPSMAYKAFEGFVARYQYTVGSHFVLLDPVVATMRESFDWLAGIFKFSDPEYDKTGWGKVVATSFGMQVEIIKEGVGNEAEWNHDQVMTGR
jgi:hypothetical protein